MREGLTPLFFLFKLSKTVVKGESMKRLLCFTLSFLSMMLLSVASLSATKISPDGTKYAIEIDGEIRANTFPTEADDLRELLIETLSSLEEENRLKRLHAQSYVELQDIYTKLVEGIIPETEIIGDRVDEIDDLTDNSEVNSMRWILLGDFSMDLLNIRQRSPPKTVGLSLLYNINISNFSGYIGPSLDFTFTDTLSAFSVGIMFGIGL